MPLGTVPTGTRVHGKGQGWDVLHSRVRGDRSGTTPQLPSTSPLAVLSECVLGLVSCGAVPCHRALVGPSGGPHAPRWGLGGMGGRGLCLQLQLSR